jgi:hypothetical protein
LIEAFDETTRRLLGEDMIGRLKLLNDLADKAENFDQLIYNGGVPKEEGGFNSWVEDAERLAGEFRGKADVYLTK